MLSLGSPTCKKVSVENELYKFVLIFNKLFLADLFIGLIKCQSATSAVKLNKLRKEKKSNLSFVQEMFSNNQDKRKYANQLKYFAT